MYDEISNGHLCERHIPRIEQNLIDVWEFALSFDGYSYKDSGKLAEFCRPVESIFLQNKKLPEGLTLTELRAILFFTQRVWRWSDEQPLDEVTNAYVESLLEAIRDKVRNEERDLSIKDDRC
jgi:hypothetical protein